MQNQIDRRGFLRTAGAAGVGLGLASLNVNRLFAAEVRKGASSAAKLGWRLGCSGWSFNVLPFYKLIDTVQALGLDSIETFNWQPLGDDKAGPKLNEAMSAADRTEAKKRLSDKGIKLVAVYCESLRTENSAKIFEWAAEMGVEYLCSQPAFDVFDLLDKLCEQYKINMAVHNHPKPDPYWNPDLLLDHLKGYGPRMGICADTGHWVRSGLDPVAMLKKVEKRLLAIHLKDIGTVGKNDADCVPYGTGKGNIAGVLEQAQRQGYKGAFQIEYEPYTAQSFANVEKCIAYFDAEAAKLVSQAAASDEKSCKDKAAK